MGRSVSRLRDKLQLNRRRGLLGGADGAPHDVDTGRYWVRPEKAPGVYAAPVRLPLNKGAMLPPAGNVVVELGVDETGQSVILGMDSGAAARQGLSPFTHNPLEPAARGLVRQEDIAPLLGFKAPGLIWTASVAPGIAIINGTVLNWAGGTIDLINYQPAAGLHRYVAVFLHRSGSLIAVGSTPESNAGDLDTTDLQEIIDRQPANSLPIKAWVFDGDQSDFSNAPAVSVDLRNAWGPANTAPGLDQAFVSRRTGAVLTSRKLGTPAYARAA